MYRVRSATRQDLLTVASWIQTPAECERWAGSQVAFPIDLVTLPETIGFSEQNAYVLEIGESVIAFGQIIDKLHGRQHLAKFIVNPLHRRRGYGRAFLSELLQRATADRVSLYVEPDNDVAIALYTVAGFVDAAPPPDQRRAPRSRYMELKHGAPAP